MRFRDVDLIGALKYLRQKAARESDGKVQIPFVVDLPQDFQPRFELTLDLHSVPCSEALRYLGELAGIEFTITPDAVIAHLGQSASRSASQKAEKPTPKATPAKAGLTGVLGKPAEPTAGGHNTYRSTSGVIQPEKSGYLPNRSLNGVFTTADPTGRRDINCIRSAPCPAAACGCGICCCLRPEKGK